jgi:hypothetical protein
MLQGTESLGPALEFFYFTFLSEVVVADFCFKKMI